MDVSTEISFFSIIAAIFLVLNAIGQIPLFLGLLARFDQKRQLKIITREMIFALVILLLFTFAGDKVLGVLGISRPIIGVAGGALLFIISLSMIFPKTVEDGPEQALKVEPMIVPLAIPVITGPGAIATAMNFAHETGSPMLVAGAILCAWVPSLVILLLGSFIKQILGEKGLVAVERLGGMLVCLISIKMLTCGIMDLVADYFRIAV
jgi:multiple antibiotic resistance protein